MTYTSPWTKGKTKTSCQNIKLTAVLQKLFCSQKKITRGRILIISYNNINNCLVLHQNTLVTFSTLPLHPECSDLPINIFVRPRCRCLIRLFLWTDRNFSIVSPFIGGLLHHQLFLNPPLNDIWKCLDLDAVVFIVLHSLLYSTLDQLMLCLNVLYK